MRGGEEELNRAFDDEYLVQRLLIAPANLALHLNTPNSKASLGKRSTDALELSAAEVMNYDLPPAQPRRWEDTQDLLAIIPCSIFFSVSSRLKTEDKVRLLGGLSLAQYAANGAAEMDVETLPECEPSLSKE